MIDPVCWTVPGLVMTTRTWLPGPHLILPKEWIRAISWANAGVIIDRDRDAVRHARPFSAAGD